MSDMDFNPRVIQLTTGVLGLVVAMVAIYSISSGTPLYKYFAYIAFPIIVTGMKLAAPRIPLLEALVCVAVIFLINVFVSYLFANHSPIFLFLGEILIPVICVFGFGARWVYKGYLPSNANQW